MIPEDTDTRRCQHCYADIAPDPAVAGRWVTVSGQVGMTKIDSPSCMYPAALLHKPLPLIELSR